VSVALLVLVLVLVLVLASTVHHANGRTPLISALIPRDAQISEVFTLIAGSSSIAAGGAGAGAACLGGVAASGSVAVADLVVNSRMVNIYLKGLGHGLDP
jgi:hypothetical protein